MKFCGRYLSIFYIYSRQERVKERLKHWSKSQQRQGISMSSHQSQSKKKQNQMRIIFLPLSLENSHCALLCCSSRVHWMHCSKVCTATTALQPSRAVSSCCRNVNNCQAWRHANCAVHDITWSYVRIQPNESVIHSCSVGAFVLHWLEMEVSCIFWMFFAKSLTK